MTFFSDFSISATLLWVVAGLVLGAAEILVGTFYLLVVAVSALLAAAAAWAGATVGWQFTVFAVAMIAGGLAVRRLRLRQGAADHEADSLQNVMLPRARPGALKSSRSTAPRSSCARRLSRPKPLEAAQSTRLGVNRTAP